MDIDFAIDEINREQDRWNLLEAELEAAEKRVAELENDPTSEWRAACLEREHFNDALKKRVAELEELLSDRETDLGYEYDRANYMDKRGTELEEALASLLDGLDSNYDERCGLTGKEWEQRIFDAGLVLKREVRG